MQFRSLAHNYRIPAIVRLYKQQITRKMHPEVFAARAELSRRIKCKLVRLKGKRIYLDELPADAVGGKMIGYECGIFCDTK